MEENTRVGIHTLYKDYTKMIKRNRNKERVIIKQHVWKSDPKELFDIAYE